ncbi:MAG: hypothetical protein LAO76_01860 [Acidobacteriia bacterium]|nr:hypothetical protein [Terriglobia bacterium]
MADLIDMLVIQQQEIVGLKASVLALLKIAQEAGLEDVHTRFQGYAADQVTQANIPEIVELNKALQTLSRQLRAKSVN